LARLIHVANARLDGCTTDRDGNFGQRPSRNARASEVPTHASESVEKGGEYVPAYVSFMHYAERLHADASTEAAHAGIAARR